MSKKLIDAITLASTLHDGQIRKMETVPYILHPMEVATIIGSMTDDEDVIIAGLLHDAVEDTNFEAQEIKERFGNRVAELVASETENKRKTLEPKSTWKIRKQESLEVLKNTTDRDIKILWLSDKLANMRVMYRSWCKLGEKMFDAFHQKNISEQKWYYESVAEYTYELKDTHAHKEYVEYMKKIFS